MKLRAIALSLALAAAATSAHAGADRQGFIIGLGIGYGNQGIDNDNFEDSYNGVATSFMIGGGISNQFTLYYLNDGQFFTVDNATQPENDGDLWAAGLTGIGGTYYFSPTSPSAYIGVGVGVTSLFDISDSNVSSYMGTGFAFAAGFEFARHLNVELSLLRGSAENEDDSSDTVDLAATRVLFKWIWY